jgi:hypothetical protein
VTALKSTVMTRLKRRGEARWGRNGAVGRAAATRRFKPPSRPAYRGDAEILQSYISEGACKLFPGSVNSGGTWQVEHFAVQGYSAGGNFLI